MATTKNWIEELTAEIVANKLFIASLEARQTATDLDRLEQEAAAVRAGDVQMDAAEYQRILADISDLRGTLARKRQAQETWDARNDIVKARGIEALRAALYAAIERSL